MATKLAAGTRFRLLGSNESDRILVLAEDVKIEEVSDAEFVGTIIDDRDNFALNIKSVPGTWNPVTGAKMLNECACGNEIPATAVNQETCETCLIVAAQADATGIAPFDGTNRRGVIADRRIQVQPLNEAPERRVGVADRRVPAEKASAKKAAKKSATKASAKKAAGKA